MTMRRSTLDWARDIARAYRSALQVVDPERCERIDAVARENKQNWVAPTQIPTDAINEAFDKKMSAADIEQFWGVKASTVRSWARSSNRDPNDSSKPLLRQYLAEDGSPLYIPREVLAVGARHRKLAGERHHDAAAGQ